MAPWNGPNKTCTVASPNNPQNGWATRTKHRSRTPVLCTRITFSYSSMISASQAIFRASLIVVIPGVYKIDGACNLLLFKNGHLHNFLTWGILNFLAEHQYYTDEATSLFTVQRTRPIYSHLLPKLSPCSLQTFIRSIIVHYLHSITFILKPCAACYGSSMYKYRMTLLTYLLTYGIQTIFSTSTEVRSMEGRHDHATVDERRNAIYCIGQKQSIILSLHNEYDSQ